ncbi:MAG: hypothetical protein HYZ75_13650 [Elusimicrobia bacterium]|nr:hypothetical protein [Elusimicrobiota bacterium]
MSLPLAVLVALSAAAAEPPPSRIAHSARNCWPADEGHPFSDHRYPKASEGALPVPPRWVERFGGSCRGTLDWLRSNEDKAWSDTDREPRERENALAFLLSNCGSADLRALAGLYESSAGRDCARCPSLAALAVTALEKRGRLDLVFSALLKRAQGRMLAWRRPRLRLGLGKPRSPAYTSRRYARG